MIVCHIILLEPHLFQSPQSPQEKAQGAKSKGNKYFKGGKYEHAIQCYTEAIEVCPPEHKTDISTFYQNRAAAQEQLVGTSCEMQPSAIIINL